LVDIAHERARIARELHDTIAQDLAAIGYALDSEIGRSDTHPESRKALRAIRERITTLNATVREEIFRLRSNRDLAPQEQLLAELQSLEIDFKVTGALPDNEVGVELGKVILELARNATVHGGAKEISVDIHPEKVLFENDGSPARERGAVGFGLTGVMERLLDIGWEYSFADDYSQVEIRRVS